MAWIGSLVLFIMYRCFFTGFIERRWEWFFLTLWMVPLFGMCLNHYKGMEINGLMILLCLGMFFLNKRGVENAKMWNIKRRKVKESVFTLLFLMMMFAVFYTTGESQVLGYLPDFQWLRKEKIDLVRYILTALPLFAVAILLTFSAYNGVDRLWVKKDGLILLECHFFISSEQGAEISLNKCYFVDGINNGEKYHFRMNKRTYQMLSREKNLCLEVCRGILGGLYVEKNPCPENEKKTRKRDRIIWITGSITTIFVIIGCVFLFW